MHRTFDAVPIPWRAGVLTGLSIATVTGLSWLYLVRLEREMCFAMDSPMRASAVMAVNLYWTTADVWLNFAMWSIMMAGMMGPSAAPLLMMFAAARTRKGERAFPAVPVFALGYIAVWTLFSAAATFAQWGLHQKAMLSVTMATTSSRLGAAILIAAGLYQLTPWKGACLAHCRSPLGFLMTHWRPRVPGAFRMGFGHGLYCLGCCWALMCVLFAVGIMNLVWVAALTVFVFLEKVGPAAATVARVGAAALVALGVAAIL